MEGMKEFRGVPRWNSTTVTPRYEWNGGTVEHGECFLHGLCPAY